MLSLSLSFCLFVVFHISNLESGRMSIPSHMKISVSPRKILKHKGFEDRLLPVLVGVAQGDLDVHLACGFRHCGSML